MTTKILFNGIPSSYRRFGSSTLNQMKLRFFNGVSMTQLIVRM
jgi:hypothetical protein